VTPFLRSHELLASMCRMGTPLREVAEALGMCLF
jgi:hypothetical protein